MRWGWAVIWLVTMVLGGVLGAGLGAAETPATAAAETPATPDEAFVAATRLPAADAARALEAQLATLPADSPVRGDALFELARLRDEELEDPVGARKAYDQLILEAPGSRLARRAESRAEALARTLGPGDRFAPTIVAIGRASRRPPGEQLAGAEELAAALAATPDFPGRAETARWIAGAYRRADRYPEARTWFERARVAADETGATDDAREARRGLAEIATAVGDYDDARARYQALRVDAAPGDLIGIDAALERIATLEARRARARWAWVVVALALVAAAAALRRTGLRALWPPPTELLYLAPPAVLLSIMALTGNVLIARAVITVLAGGLLVTWISGALLDAARARDALTLRRVVAHATLALVVVGAIGILALSRDALLDLIAATFRDGVER